MATGVTGNEAPEPSSTQEVEIPSAAPSPVAKAAGPDAYPGPSSPGGQVQPEQMVPEVKMADSGIQEESDGAKEPAATGDQSDIPTVDPTANTRNSCS